MPSDGNKNRMRSSFEEAWRRRFQAFANNDDDAGIAGWSATGLQARFRHFARVWPGDAAGSLWLDVGCGAGTYSRFLAAMQMQVIAMDYSYPTVLKARERSDPSGRWAVADAARLPVTTGAFDGVMCFGVIQALEQSAPAVSELIRAAKPGGQIWVDALNGWCPPNLWDRFVRWLRRRPLHVRYESPGRLRRLMRVGGCDGIRLFWVPILPQGLQRYQRLLEAPAARWILHHFPIAGAVLSHAFVLQGKRVS